MGFHQPVLLNEVLDGLNLQAPGRCDKTYVDCTLGGGGHSEGILRHLSSQGRLIALDQDVEALSYAQGRLQVPPWRGLRGDFVHANFTELSRVLSQQGVQRVDGGVLADLGVSSHQLDTGSRGFSFTKPAPLDMRMDASQSFTAADIVNTYDEASLIRIFSEYGEERFSRSIARKILEERVKHPIETTTGLAELITRVRRPVPHAKIHPATQVFQALRIEVNHELDALQALLSQLPDSLAPGARVVMISFHSLEDRLIKRFFRQESQDCICPPQYPVCQCQHRATFKLITRSPILASPEEIRQNPRARSAKLRVAERI